MSGRLIPRQAHIRTAAAIMIRFNQCMSVLIFATRILISIRHASRSSLSMFSPPLIYDSVIHKQEYSVWSCRGVERQRFADGSLEVQSCPARILKATCVQTPDRD